MGNKKSINKHIRLFLLWIMTLVYYNVIECFLVIDRLWFIDVIHYTYMDLRAAFVIYPSIAYLVCFLNKTSPIKYYSIVIILCLAYAFVVVFFNISYFPIKTWFILVFFLCSIVVCIKFDKIEKSITIKNGYMVKQPVLSALTSFLIVVLIIVTVFCHAWLI